MKILILALIILTIASLIALNSIRDAIESGKFNTQKIMTWSIVFFIIFYLTIQIGRVIL